VVAVVQHLVIYKIKEFVHPEMSLKGISDLEKEREGLTEKEGWAGRSTSRHI
jgi:hypothetical protein